MTKKLAVLLFTVGLLSASGQSSETSKTITGLLMDASCAPIASTRSSAPNPATETEHRSAALSGGPAHASATGTTGAASNTAAPSPRAGAEDRRDTEVVPDRNTRRETEAAVRGNPTAGPSYSSATGTTGAAVDTTPPQTSHVQGSATRGRSEPPSGALTAAETVAEKYAACRPDEKTTHFAIHASGELYILDNDSNDMVRKQMRNEAFRASMSNGRDGSRWMTVTVLGTTGPGNNLKVESVRK